MRILLHSNGPQARTGYGIQTALLARRLRDAGHEVAISAYFGAPTGISTWENIPVYPQRFDSYGNDVLHDHALHWFGGDPLAGWVIPLMDVFGLNTPALAEFNVAAWTPVDHYPVPKAVLEFFSRNQAVPIAMSRYGEKLLSQAGLDPLYVPLAFDGDVYKPTVEAGGLTGRQIMNVDDDKFVVMMNGMNKGWSWDRKGFTYAFKAFAEFARQHPDAVLYMHTEIYGGANGFNLGEAAVHSGVGEHQIQWANQYAYTVLGYPGEALAALYTAADVLLAPSMGEGFCVPLIEAQACGTPVIVTDFSAQPELVGGGWKVPSAVPYWDAAQSAHVVIPDIQSIIEALNQAYEAKQSGELTSLGESAQRLAAGYDADKVFAEYWLPVLDELDGDRVTLTLKDGRPPMERVAVLVPVLDRPHNVAPLVESFNEANDGTAELYFICDELDHDEIDAVKEAGGNVILSDRGSSFAQKINAGFAQTLEDFVFVSGDDVRFTEGWLAAARELTDRFDVIGSNDSPDGTGNPKVAAGAHADHFFIRRTYVDEHGGCLDGPHLVCHEGYQHFYSDVETVELAKARGVFTPCMDCLVEHLHPDMGKAEVDDTYRKGWGARGADEKVWRRRAPLVAQQITGRGKVRAA